MSIKNLASEGYVGRYAPSPTGRMHFGNLRTALLAWLHARLHKGRFLLRMEDLDIPRVVAGSAQQIVNDLQWLGLDWDDAIYVQSRSQINYHETFEQLRVQRLVYPCFCSRKDIQLALSAPHGTSSSYPGTCSGLTEQERNEKSQEKNPAWRFRVPQNEILFNDGCGESVTESLPDSCGDFVVKRADGLYAYQFAVVVDDIKQGITNVVRGADLLQSTARQISLYETLGSAVPEFWHVPLMVDKTNARMSKRDGSDSLEQWQKEGRSASELVGYLAHSLGLLPPGQSLCAGELLEEMVCEEFQDRVSLGQELGL